MFESNLLSIAGLLIGIMGAVWSLAWWLNGHFNNIRKDFSSIAKEIVSKLEYHERHDDVRFSQLRDDIWDIRVRNAAFDGTVPPPRHLKKEAVD